MGLYLLAEVASMVFTRPVCQIWQITIKRNFGTVQMNLETFEKLFKLADGLVLLVSTWRKALKTVVSCHLPNYTVSRKKVPLYFCL